MIPAFELLALWTSVRRFSMMKAQHMYLFRCALTLLALITGGLSHAGIESASVDGRWKFPQTRLADGYSILMHSPQIRSWSDFERFEAWSAVEVTHPDGERTDLGVMVVTGDTRIDFDRRVVRSSAPRLEKTFFKNPTTQGMRAALGAILADESFEMPLDLFLAHLADSVIESEPPAGFNFEPPTILLERQPTVLLVIEGVLVLADIDGTPVRRVVNANWPLFRVAADDRYFLLVDRGWYSAIDLAGLWTPTTSLPDAFGSLPAEPAFDAIRAALPPTVAGADVPTVRYSASPAELIVIDGETRLEEIPNTGGLAYVTNTNSPLFRFRGSWYFLTAGRWFATTGDPGTGPWVWQRSLPGAFARIPVAHAVADVRAAVNGTPEARMAALEAMLPVRQGIAVNSSAPVEVSYGGAPQFEAIPGTALERAVNANYDVLRHADLYYLCYGGAWYESTNATGPWLVTLNVPQAVYTIPPSSPAYHVTQVKLHEATASEVVYTYPAGYATSTYIVYGVPYYGTGWHYAPWIYGGYYYPYYGSYGYNSWYNPSSGRYGQRTVVADGDEMGSYSGTYNPRTGVASITQRYYDADDDRTAMQRTVGNDDVWMETRRETDLDRQVSVTERTTSRGGESTVTRTWDDGRMTSSGTVEAADGRTATIEGSRDSTGRTTTISGSGGDQATISRSIDGSHVTREASITRDGETVTREGRQGTSDLYAGQQGLVFQKRGDEWQAYDGERWRSTASDGTAARQDGGREILSSVKNLNPSASERWHFDDQALAQLERDRSARESSRRSMESRQGWDRAAQHGGFDRGSFQRSGLSRGGLSRGSFSGGGGRRR